MKKISKVISLTLALILMMSLSLTALAEEATPYAVQNNGVIQVSGPQLEGKNVTIVRMFTANLNKDGTVGYELEAAWQNFFNEQLHKAPGENATSQEAYDHVSNMKNNEEQLVALAKAAKVEYNKGSSPFAGLAVTKNAVGADSVTFDNLKSGYYLVLPQNGSTAANRATDAMLVNVSDNQQGTVQLKTEYPTVDKTVTPENGHGSSAQIGDKVSFTLTSKVPNMADYNTYVFNFKDTLSQGLTLDQGSITVTIGDHVLNTPKDYTVNVDPTSSQPNTVLTIKMMNFKNFVDTNGIAAGTAIKVEYTATLNKNAQTGMNPNTNQAEVEYSNDPSNDGTGTSKPSITNTYAFEMKVHKWAQDTTQGTGIIGEKLLPGAVFKLQDDKGTSIKLVKVSETEYRVATADDATTVESFTTVANGDIIIKGLKEGTYQLVESAAPEGYNKLSKPVKVVIAAQYNPDGTLADAQPTYTVDGKAPSTDNTIKIENKAGAFLPETGSIGTIGLTIAGVALVVGGIGFTSRKKKEQA